MLRILILLVGVYACSTAVIFIKASQVHPLALSAWRLIVAAVALTPLMLRDYARLRGGFALSNLKHTLLPGLMLALHFITWIIGARMTPAANSSLIVNMIPIVMPFFMFFLVRERLTAGELLGTVISLTGVGLLGAADVNVSLAFFQGDLWCFVSMLLLAFYLALGRKNRSFPAIWLYIVPLYYAAGLFCLAAAALLADPFRAYPLRELVLILALGIVPTVVGHSILNYSMKHLRGQVVSILNLGQFVFAAIMGFLFYAEVPSWPMYVASAALVAGAVIVLRAQNAPCIPANHP